LIED
jgi:chromosome segregation ATPase